MSYRTHAKYKSNFSTWESLDEYAELMIDYIEAYKVFRERYSIWEDGQATDYAWRDAI